MTPDRYVIVLKIPEPEAKFFAAWRKKYDIFSRRWLPPHLTIIPPFRAIMTDELRHALLSFSFDCTIRYFGWGTFQRAEFGTVFVQVAEEAVQKLYEEMMLRFPQLKEFTAVKMKRKFDITVASHIPMHKIDQVLAGVSKQTAVGAFTVHGLTMYQWSHQQKNWMELTS